MASPRLEEIALVPDYDEEQLATKRPRLAEPESRQPSTSSSAEISDSLEQPVNLRETIGIRAYHSSVQCDLEWELATAKTDDGHKLKLEVRTHSGGENHGETITWEFPTSVSSHSIVTVPGRRYTVALALIHKDSGKVREGKVDFLAVFSRKELTDLKDKMLEFADTNYSSTRMHMITHLYRVKDPEDWIQIEKGDGFMKKREKDNTGHPGSAINVAQMKGLFFGATLFKGELPTISPYGTQRMKISAGKLIDPSKANAYFADFYCLTPTSPHYVIVVIAECGTQSDEFGAKYLLPLDWESNSILRAVYEALSDDENDEDAEMDGTEEGEGVPDGAVAGGSGNGGGRAPTLVHSVNAAEKLWVEVYWTGEEIPLTWKDGSWETVEKKFGTSKLTPGGIGHNKSCYKCNLYL